MSTRSLRCALLVASVALSATAPASGHHPFRLVVVPRPWVQPAPWWNPYPMWATPGYGPYPIGDPYGGYLKGAAELTRAQADYLKGVQQAYQLAEQVKQSQIETRRREQEQWLWEKQNLPSPAQERERAQQADVRRSVTNAPLTEVWSASALNTILADLQEMRNKGYDGPRVALEGDILARIGVTTGKAPINTALLKQIGKLDWPAVLRTLPPEDQSRAVRMQIDALLVEARRQALQQGKVDARLARELEANVQSLLDLLARRVDEYSFNQYTEARRYLRQLGDAAVVLQQPDAANYFNGRYTARGATVGELVSYLSENGLRFAPAAGGDEAAYTALYQALAEYHRGVNRQLPTR